MKITKSQNHGFTIVELLIVVVVIAVLAAIIIVGYTGISSRSRQTTMQANLESVSKLLFNFRTLSGAYPASLNQLNDGRGVNTSNGMQYAYTVTGDDFLLTIGSASSADRYRTSGSSGKIESGVWTGHDAILAGYPSRLGYTDISASYGSGDTIAVPINSVPTGSWMIVVLTTYVGADNTAPAGWTQLWPRKVTNTLMTSIYAKIKQAGDADSQEFDAAGASGRAFINGALMWGGNSAAVALWTLGAFGDRSVNATSTTAVTPTISVPAARSLVLSIATERTNADETNYTSLVGAIPWVWIPQPTGDLNKNQTIAVGYNEQASTGTSQVMTVTYPNAQATNATAVQIAIPPAP